MNSFQQLPLPLRFDQSSSFDHFYSDDDYVTHTLKNQIDTLPEPLVLVNGQSSTGKSHLLNAAALYCQQKHITFQYFEASMLLEYGIDIIAPCEKGQVLIIDDLHCLAGGDEWERKLYDLYNDAQRNQWLLITSNLKSEDDKYRLKDLSSRLSAAVHLTLTNADEGQLKKVVLFRAKLLGLKLKPEVIDYLLVHYPRDLTVQITLLQQLDESALEQNRNITIPFIKQILPA